MDTRRVNVQQAKASFEQFLHICAQNMILHESELKKIENVGIIMLFFYTLAP
jgi:hypothetical protein